MSRTKRKAGKRKEEDNEDQLQAYINTLKKTFNEMNLLSRGATFRQEDTGVLM